MMKTVDDLARRWLQRAASELDEEEKRVLLRAVARRPVSTNANDTLDGQSTLGNRIADKIAEFGGSWSFILGFLAFLVAWAVFNAYLLGRDAFDPYPFIFLNLILSMIAALQAPVIMMSQNRQSDRDRIEAAHDYEVNLKAEIEIMALHEKLDEMRHREFVQILDSLAAIDARLASLEDRMQR